MDDGIVLIDRSEVHARHFAIDRLLGQWRGPGLPDVDESTVVPGNVGW